MEGFDLRGFRPNILTEATQNHGDYRERILAGSTLVVADSLFYSSEHDDDMAEYLGPPFRNYAMPLRNVADGTLWEDSLKALWTGRIQAIHIDK